MPPQWVLHRPPGARGGGTGRADRRRIHFEPPGRTLQTKAVADIPVTQSMKILSVPLPIQPLPSPPFLPLSSEHIGLFLLHLVAMWELQKANSLLICGRSWDRVPKVFPLHPVRQQSLPRGSLQGFVCPSGGGMAGGAPLPASSGGTPGS